MEECKTYTLEEISKGKGGYGIAAPAVEYNPNLYKYLRITDINDDGSLKRESVMSVSDDKAEKYLLHKNDIVFARTGNSTGRTYFYEETEGELVYAGFLIKFSLDETKVNPKILKYYTHSQLYYDWVRSFDTGGTRGNINAKTFGSMPIMLPNRTIQDKIVNILSSLDDKIELNRRINANLEEQAQALFKSWFIDFEPFKDGKFVDSELGMIPEGWKVGTLEDLIEIRYGKDHKKLNDGNIPVYGSGGIMRYVETAIYDRESVLIPRKGTLNNVMYVNQPFWSVDTMFYTIMKEPNIAKFVYLFLERKDLSAMNNGSAVPSMTTNILNSLQVVLPSKDIFKRFEEVVGAIWNVRMSNLQESARLSALRDTLLPKLMSGEINIES